MINKNVGPPEEVRAEEAPKIMTKPLPRLAQYLKRLPQSLPALEQALVLGQGQGVGLVLALELELVPVQRTPQTNQ